MHREGRNAIVSEGGVDRHSGSGPVPVVVWFWIIDVQAGQDCRQQFADRCGATTTIRVLLQDFGNDLGLMVTRLVWQLADGGSQVSKNATHRCLVVVVEAAELFQDRIRFLKTGMPHRFISGDTGKHQATESLGNLHPASSFIDAPRFVYVRLSTVVIAVTDEVVCDPHEHAPQAAIRLANDGTAIVIRLVALMA
jgi:hypothetical protein